MRGKREYPIFLINYIKNLEKHLEEGNYMPRELINRIKVGGWRKQERDSVLPS